MSCLCNMSGVVQLTISQETPISLTVVDGGAIGPEYEHYAGAYEVIPSDEKTTLPTAHKVADSDITIHPIPFFEVSNTAGGNTIYIGGEIERS